MAGRKRIYEMPQILSYEKEVAFFIKNKFPKEAFAEYLRDARNTLVDEPILLQMWSKVSGRMILGRVHFDDDFYAGLDKSVVRQLAKKHYRDINI